MYKQLGGKKIKICLGFDTRKVAGINQATFYEMANIFGKPHFHCHDFVRCDIGIMHHKQPAAPQPINQSIY